MSDVALTIDGSEVTVPAGTTILQACGGREGGIPTLCYGDTITPKNACRVCMVEVEGSRVLVPSCSRKVEPGMVVTTRSDRVDHARKMVLEFLGSSVDLSLTDHVDEWNAEYGADPGRYGTDAATVAQPVKVDNELYVRDYAKCILCYQCVDACGEQWQNSFVIEIAGRGFGSRVSTEHDVPLPESACVYCGNCIQVCPTGALMFKSEYDMRAAGTWDESRQTQTDTVCAYCGVGCNLTLHVQDNTIVKVMSPADSSITHGNLCIKGRFGFQHAQNRPD
ncbi:MAG TPA: 2Fe-2S iron-sulfur cluster-binding protein [Ilumatobacter sp.]|jgi:predicted molibdopterin-dependent oxidoreductase YjgC|nr:2Fe-2S iron-sulfur cluster-binding protein [Ilumatobacter sp.]